MNKVKKCHNCKGKGFVDGGAKKQGKEPKLMGKCLYCKGEGTRK